MKRILSIPKNIVDFFRGTIAEMQMVQWVSGKTVVTYTFYIVMFLFVGAVVILFLDEAFLFLRGLLIPA